jgi:dTDP-4-amino-4,6-dideoxygalactose transaminase
MTDIAAAIGIEQLKKLPYFNKKRREHAQFFNENLIDIKDFELPYILENTEHVYHQYTLKCKNREELIQHLKKNDIGYGIYYPKPLHFYSHLKKYAHDDLKNSENLAGEVLSLPVHPGLNNQDLETIISCIKQNFLHSYS